MVRRRLARTRGASYSLPVILVMPPSLVFLFAVIDGVLLLQAKLGAQYAAAAAARAASVWDANPTPPKLAAWNAVLPYAAVRANHPDNGPTPPEAAQYSTDPRFHAAAARTKVLVEVVGEDGPHARLKVTLVYRAPLLTPVASRFYDPDGTAPWEVPAEAVVFTTREAPETKGRTFGIPYTPKLPPPGGTP